MSESRDKPLLEVYPWYLVVLLSFFWGLLWFSLWAALRGATAAVVVGFGSIEDVGYFPWLIPFQIGVWLASAIWIYKDVRAERDPPPLVCAVCLLLLMTFPGSAFYMLARLDRLSESHLSRNATAVLFRDILNMGIPAIVALVLTLPMGAYTNFVVLRRKYRNLHPERRSLIIAAWAVGGLVAIAVARVYGTMWGFFLMPALGNSVTIHCFRQAIRKRIRRVAGNQVQPAGDAEGSSSDS